MSKSWHLAIPVMLLGIVLATLPTVLMADASVNPSICRLDVQATVVNKVGPCPDGARVATYEYAPGAQPGPFGPETFPQSLFDVGETQATLPPCAWQADLFTGDVVETVDGAHLYGDRLIDAAQGGTEACGTTTTTSTTATTAPAPTFPTTSTPPTFGKCAAGDMACNVGSTFTVPSTTTATTTLARTGAGVGWLAALGLGVLTLGVVLIAAARNRKVRV